jgi:hypothetical protein
VIWFFMFLSYMAGYAVACWQMQTARPRYDEE